MILNCHALLGKKKVIIYIDYKKFLGGGIRISP